MKKVYFDRRMQGQPGQTVGPNGEEIHYILHRINGMGEPLAYQVDRESRNGRGSIVFERTNYLEENGIHYFLK